MNNLVKTLSLLCLLTILPTRVHGEESISIPSLKLDGSKENIVSILQKQMEEKGSSQKDFILFVLKEEKENSKDTDIKENIDSIINQLDKEKGIFINDAGEKFDMTQVANDWIRWQNEIRNSLGLGEYTYTNLLNKSAYDWAKTNKERGDMSHKRISSDSYYDYNKITKWMKDEGVVCKNISRATYSESIGYGTFSCSDEDCSDELSKAIKGTFNFFMSEKNKSYQPHYKAITSKYFSQIGLGISIDSLGENRYKYYLTTHYCTELITK